MTRARKSSLIEVLFYESKPVLLLALGLYGFNQIEGGQTTQIGKLSVFLLFVCTALIIFGRLKNRGLLR